MAKREVLDVELAVEQRCRGPARPPGRGRAAGVGQVRSSRGSATRRSSRRPTRAPVRRPRGSSARRGTARSASSGRARAGSRRRRGRSRGARARPASAALDRRRRQALGLARRRDAELRPWWRRRTRSSGPAAERAAEDALGLAGVVCVGGVEHADPPLERAPHDALALLGRGSLAEVHRPEGQGGRLAGRPDGHGAGRHHGPLSATAGARAHPRSQRGRAPGRRGRSRATRASRSRALSRSGHDGASLRQEDLRAFVQDGVDVTADGARCEPTYRGSSPTEQDGLLLEASYACPPGATEIGVTLYYLSTLSPGHREVARIVGPPGTERRRWRAVLTGRPPGTRLLGTLPGRGARRRARPGVA